MEGDTFSLKKQRNWDDYSSPLDDPWPRCGERHGFHDAKACAA